MPCSLGLIRARISHCVCLWGGGGGRAQVSAPWAFAYGETVCALYRDNFFGHAVAVAADFLVVVRKFHGAKLCADREVTVTPDVSENLSETDMTSAGSLLPTSALAPFPLPVTDHAAVIDAYITILRVVAKIGAAVSALSRDHADSVVVGSVGAVAIHLLHAGLNDAFMMARTALEQARCALLQEDIRAHRSLASGRRSLRTAAKGLGHLAASACARGLAPAAAQADLATSTSDLEESVAYLACGALAGLQLCALGRSPLSLSSVSGAAVTVGDSSTDDNDSGSEDEETPASRDSTRSLNGVGAVTTVAGRRVDSFTGRMRGFGSGYASLLASEYSLLNLVSWSGAMPVGAGDASFVELFRSQDKRMKLLTRSLHCTADLCVASLTHTADVGVLAKNCHVFNRARALYAFAVQCCVNSDAASVEDVDGGAREDDSVGGLTRKACNRSLRGGQDALAFGALLECVLMQFRADGEVGSDRGPRGLLAASELCRSSCVLLERAALGCDMYSVAVEALEAALRIQVSRGGIHAAALGRMHRRIATLCARQGDCGRGLKYFNLVLRECMDAASFDEIVFVVSKMQDLCMEGSKLLEAKDIIEQAMAYFQAVGVAASGSLVGDVSAKHAAVDNPYVRRLSVMLGSMCMSVGAYDIAVNAFASCIDHKLLGGGGYSRSGDAATRIWLAKVRAPMMLSGAV